MKFKKLVMMLLLSSLTISTFYNNIIKAENEEKAYSNASINDEFSNEKVNNYRCMMTLELEEKTKENVLKTIEELEKREDIYYVGPDYVVKATSTQPNDEYYNVSQIASDYQWGSDQIDLPSAWDETTGSDKVLVGVLDTGIDGTHPDLVNRIDTSLCRDFTSGSEVIVTNPTDQNGHGTQVAGIIGAQGNNKTYIAGVCWDVRLVSLKVLDDNASGYCSNVARAVDFANANNIPILNMSLGWHEDDSNYDKEVKPLDVSIGNYYGLVVCAAGNEGYDNDDYNHYPSNFTKTYDNVISVGASDKDDKILEKNNVKSHYGLTTVDLFAPGYGIVTTAVLALDSSGHTVRDGTSMATPFVTGVAALLLAKNPHLTPSKIKEVILNNIDKKPDLSDMCVSGGRLNARKALASVSEDVVSYSYYNDSLHKVSCTCKGTYYESHSWVVVPITTITELGIAAILKSYSCRYCGAIKLG